jgi:hypothetical protein
MKLWPLVTLLYQHLIEEMWLAMLAISADCRGKGVIPWHKSIQGFKPFEFRLIVLGKCIYYAKKSR